MASQPTDGSDFARLYQRIDGVDGGLDDELSPERRREILAARARALAPARIDEQHETAEVLAFRVGGERYAVGIREVDEVLDIRGLYPLLGAPRHVLGAIFARAQVVPVLDLRQLLGLQGGGMSDLTRVVVVGTEPELFGLAVEEVEGRLDLPSKDWERPATGPFLHVTADRMAVLDLAALGEPDALKPQ